MDLSESILSKGKFVANGVKWFILLSALGLITNFTLMVFQWDTIGLIWSEQATGSDNLWQSYLLMLSVIVLPIVYVGFAQRYAVEKVALLVMQDNAHSIVKMMLTKFFEKHPKLFDWQQKSGDIALKGINNISNYIGNLPLFVGPLLSTIASAMDLGSKLTSAVESIQMEGLSKDEKLDQITEVVAEQIPEDLFEPDPMLLQILFVVNIALFFI